MINNRPRKPEPAPPGGLRGRSGGGFMLSYCVDTMGYLISSTLLDDFFQISALCACILCVRILFHRRVDTL